MDKILSKVNPENSESLKIGEKAINKNCMLIIEGRCIIDYQGRSVTEGHMPEGDRLVFLKKDGTMHVHSTEKKSPIRYQNSGAKAEIKEKDNEVILKTTGYNKGTKEEVIVFFREIYQVSSFNAVDRKVSSSSDSLRGTEKDMKKYIRKNPEHIEKGFTYIEEERKTKEGPVDIFGRDKKGNAVILELKARHAQRDHVRQLNSYINKYKEQERNVRGILVAPSIAKTASKKLKDEGHEFIKLEPLEGVNDKEISSKTDLSDYEK